MSRLPVSDTTREQEVIIIVGVPFREAVSDTELFTASMTDATADEATIPTSGTLLNYPRRAAAAAAFFDSIFFAFPAGATVISLR